MNNQWVAPVKIPPAHSDRVALSPLGLLHRDGKVTRGRILGSNCPPRLVPPGCDMSADQADLVLWTPTAEECQIPGWLEQTATQVKESLAADGLVYAMIPRRWRLKAQRLLQKHGLEVGLSLIHLPDWPSSRYLVPLQRHVADYALTRLFPTRAGVRALALGMLRVPDGNRLLGWLVPWVGFAAYQPGSQRLFDWLYQWIGLPPGAGRVLMGASWKGDRCSIILHCFAGEANPCMVAKTLLPQPGHFEDADEARILTRLREPVIRAGARCPQPISIKEIGGSPFFLQSVVPGKSAATVLAGRPDQIPTLVERVLAWLGPWNKSTAILRPLDPLLIDRELITPLEKIAPFLQDASSYRQWLCDHCAEINDPVPFVAAHNDLTSWNILVEPGSPLGIVDWREACPGGLPLQDFFYTLVDIISTGQGCGRETAFLACISPTGQYARLFYPALERMKRSLGLTEPLVELCLHACFLHHAANEQDERTPEEDHPFLDIVSWLETNRPAFMGRER